jgi:hypothetical protein
MFWVHFQRRQSCRVCRNALGRTDFSQAKVENLGVAALGHKNIRGLDVTVNDALGVCGVQSIGHVNSDSQERFQLHRNGPIMCLSVCPSRNSMAMKALPFSSPMS